MTEDDDFQTWLRDHSYNDGVGLPMVALSTLRELWDGKRAAERKLGDTEVDRNTWRDQAIADRAQLDRVSKDYDRLKTATAALCVQVERRRMGGPANISLPRTTKVRAALDSR
jgi:hypothetical protein